MMTSTLDPNSLEIKEEYTADRDKTGYIKMGVTNAEYLYPFFEMQDSRYNSIIFNTRTGSPLLLINQLNNAEPLVNHTLFHLNYMSSRNVPSQLSIGFYEQPTGDGRFTNNTLLVEQNTHDGCGFTIHIGKSFACNDLIHYQGNGFRCIVYFSSYLSGNYPLIENTLDNSDPKPARLAIRRHIVEGKKAISLVCQRDDGIEFLVVRRIIGEKNNESQINEENFKKFLESDTWKIITENYANSNKTNM